jgi:hypothetical protein
MAQELLDDVPVQTLEYLVYTPFRHVLLSAFLFLMTKLLQGLENCK